MFAKVGRVKAETSSKVGINPSYVGRRLDIVELISGQPANVLDLGCSDGSLARDLRSALPSIERIVGVELDAPSAELADRHCDRVFLDDVDSALNSPEMQDEGPFDLIVAADILEHLVDPWAALEQCFALLKPSGTLTTSLPNVRHYSVAANVVSKANGRIVLAGSTTGPTSASSA